MFQNVCMKARKRKKFSSSWTNYYLINRCERIISKKRKNGVYEKTGSQCYNLR